MIHKNKNVYIIDRLEHGNGGVYGSKILDRLPLRLALKTTPMKYNVFSKEWGFWPVISIENDSNKPIYLWDEDEFTWIEYK